MDLFEWKNANDLSFDTVDGSMIVAAQRRVGLFRRLRVVDDVSATVAHKAIVGTWMRRLLQ